MKNDVVKKHILMILAALLLLTSCASEAEPVPEVSPVVSPMSGAQKPEGAIAFSVKNSIGADIYQLRVSPNFLNEFSEDILKNDILQNTQSMPVYFMPPDTYTYWDIRVLTENGSIYTWQNVVFDGWEEIELMLGDMGPEFNTY